MTRRGALVESFGPRERLAQQGFMYWLGHMAPNIGQNLNDLAALYEEILATAVAPEDRERWEDGLFHPGVNPHLALILGLAACDGFLPSGKDRARYRQERIPTVDLARLVNVEPRQLAGSFKEVGVRPRNARFEGQVTKAYHAKDFREAYHREVGRWIDRCVREIQSVQRLVSSSPSPVT